MIPYWSLFLENQKFSASTIGVLMGVFHFSRIFAPTLWGWLSDITGCRIGIVRIGAALTSLIFLGIFWQEGALGIGLIMLGYSFFWNAILPQFEVITLEHLEEEKQKYSRVRLWGSIGFIMAVLIVGWGLEFVGIHNLPFILLLLMLLIWGNTLLIAEKKAPSVPQIGQEHSLWAIIKQPQVAAFFVITLLVQFSHGPYYTFFSVLMQEQGFESTSIGILWALGVVAEVLIFILMPTLLSRFGCRQILLISLFLTAVRWALTGLFSEYLSVIILAQLLHAASFGCLHAVGISLVHHYFPDTMQGRGQALFSSIGFGVGGTCGAIVSGILWDYGALVSFSVAAVASGVAFWVAYIWIYPEKVHQNRY